MPLVGELEVGIGPKVSGFLWSWSVPPTYCFHKGEFVKWYQGQLHLMELDIYMRNSSNKVDVLEEVSQREISSFGEIKG